MSALKSASSSVWSLSMENLSVGSMYNTGSDSVNIKIEFDGIQANLYVNDTEFLSNVPYPSGDIEKIRITTGPEGHSSTDGIGHFDNFLLSGYSSEVDSTGGGLFANIPGYNMTTIVIICTLAIGWLIKGNRERRK